MAALFDVILRGLRDTGFFAERKQALLPIGSIYINATDSTNPAALLGYGTWGAAGAGRVLIGVGTGVDANALPKTFGAGSMGGEYAHKLTIPEMPSHDHKSPTGTTGGGNGAQSGPPTGQGITTAATGGDGAHNNVQPYLTVYMWVRTA